MFFLHFCPKVSSRDHNFEDFENFRKKIIIIFCFSGKSDSLWNKLLHHHILLPLQPTQIPQPSQCHKYYVVIIQQRNQLLRNPTHQHLSLHGILLRNQIRRHPRSSSPGWSMLTPQQLHHHLDSLCVVLQALFPRLFDFVRQITDSSQSCDNAIVVFGFHLGGKEGDEGGDEGFVIDEPESILLHSTSISNLSCKRSRRIGNKICCHGVDDFSLEKIRFHP
mmetsp:Transcript_33768/g.52818  ORF Transcript_33768/g.52818 Transcript_33768/m.52818 type:complete len:221 (-) Transcript_33768:7-669(-)